MMGLDAILFKLTQYKTPEMKNFFFIYFFIGSKSYFQEENQ